jgi:ubiquinone/menaquinone biosynthesis C-methylase UbiE
MLHHVVEWKRALREATRVLRSSGTFIGYDITKTPVGELVHRFDRSPHRLVALGEFAPSLLEVGLHSVSVRPSLARHLVRFAGTK